MENDQATLIAEDIGTPEVEVNEPQSMTEIMQSKLEEIRERDSENADIEEKKEKARAPDGKFAKEDKVKSEAAQQDNNQINTQPVEQVQETEQTRAPASWTNAAKAEFAKASPVIQQEVLKREQQMHNGIAQYKEAATFGSQIYKAIQPYENTLKTLGLSADTAVQYLFGFDHKLRNGSPQEKLHTFSQMAQAYGIDLRNGLPQQQQVDPNFQYLQSQLQNTQQQLKHVLTAQQQREQAEQQREHDALNNHLATFAKDKPHYEALRYSMGTLIQDAHSRGENLSLDQAYEAAMWASPQYRQELLSKQLEAQKSDAEKARSENVKKAQAAAKSAKAASSTNVARRGTLPAQTAVGNTKELMTDILAQIRSR